MWFHWIVILAKGYRVKCTPDCLQEFLGQSDPFCGVRGHLKSILPKKIKTHFPLNGFALFLEFNKLILFKKTCWEQIFGIFIFIRPSLWMVVLWYGVVCLSVRPSVHISLGQDLSLTVFSKFFKLNGYTTSRKRKKPIYFQGQRSKIKVSGP